MDDPRNKEGFKVDDYFVCFAPGEFVTENEDGTMSILVDIYKITKENQLDKIPAEEVDEQLENKISAYINEMLIQAVNKALEEHNVKD